MKCGAPAPISEARYPDPGNRRHCNLPFSACSHFYYNRSDERKIQKTPCFPISRREIGLPKGDWSSRREIGLPKGDWKAWSISTNIPFWGIGIAPILSPVTAKGRVRSAD